MSLSQTLYKSSVFLFKRSFSMRTCMVIVLTVLIHVDVVFALWLKNIHFCFSLYTQYSHQFCEKNSC